MRVYIKEHKSHAGFWIYRGYFKAWKSLGYDPSFYKNIEDIGEEKDFFLMCNDSDIKQENIKILERAKRAFIFVQPNTFPMPWGKHPNYVSLCHESVIREINEMKNVFQWTFADVEKDFYYLWNNPSTVPLAFDSESYIYKKRDYKYDVCYIGGRANNGFDEKYKIMMNTFSHFMNSGLRCAFFVGKNLTHEQEQDILCSSRIALNIHDEYQRKLSLDTNERTFKSLGMTGQMVSDKINQIKNIFPDIDIEMSLEYKEIKDKVDSILSCPLSEQELIKEKNREIINNKHTYKNRILKMLGE